MRIFKNIKPTTRAWCVLIFTCLIGIPIIPVGIVIVALIGAYEAIVYFLRAERDVLIELWQETKQ